MWATHPIDHDREGNAKRVYVQASIDDRSSWDIFSDPKAIRVKMTKELIETADVKTEPISTDEALENQNELFQRSYLDPRYRGVYRYENLCLHVKKPSEIYLPDLGSGHLQNRLKEVYPESLSKDLDELKNVDEELELLKALKEKVLTAPGGVITHRGNQVRRKDLSKVIEAVDKEVVESRNRILKHLSYCRTVHLKAAEQIGKGWKEYLKGLLRVIHYAEHSDANIRDVYRVLNNTLQVVLADGKVSSEEAKRVIRASNDVFKVLKGVYGQQEFVLLDESILSKMEVRSWSEVLEELKLGSANHENINEWLNVIESWIIASTQSISELKSVATEILLETEAFVVEIIENGGETDKTAPKPSVVPNEYALLMPGMERPIQKKLGPWDSFVTADGTLPAIARSLVALIIIGITVGFGAGFASSHITVYNGLGRPVVVHTSGKSIEVGPHSHEDFKVYKSGRIMLETLTEDGEYIESINGDLGNTPGDFVYNIGRSGAMVVWTAFYGGGGYDDSRSLGNPLWMEAKVDHLFEQPPNSVETSGGRTTRDVLTAYSTEGPSTILEHLNEKQRRSMIRSHASWDEPDYPYILEWLNLATELGLADSILDQRLRRNPNEVVSLRQRQEATTGSDKETVCKAHKAQQLKNPDNPNWYYLSCRCIEDAKEADEAFKTGYERWPKNNWLAWAAGHIYAQEDEWEKCRKAFKTNSCQKLYIEKLRAR